MAMTALQINAFKTAFGNINISVLCPLGYYCACCFFGQHGRRWKSGMAGQIPNSGMPHLPDLFSVLWLY